MEAHSNMTSTNTSTIGHNVVDLDDQPGGLGLPKEEEIYGDVHWSAYAPPLRLRGTTVMCLIFNRMIGMFPTYLVEIITRCS